MVTVLRVAPVLAGMTRFRDAGLAVLCGVFAIGVATVFVTFSRSAAVGLAAGLAFAFLLLALRRDWPSLATWGAAVLVAVLVTAPLVRPYTDYLVARANPSAQAEGSTEERSLSEREVLASNTNEIFLDHPLTGVGAAIADMFTAIAAARVPITTLLIGEGGSGGALAFAAPERMWVTPDSYFAVISPELAAAILKRDAAQTRETADQLRLRPQDLVGLGIARGITEQQRQ